MCFSHCDIASDSDLSDSKALALSMKLQPLQEALKEGNDFNSYGVRR